MNLRRPRADELSKLRAMHEPFKNQFKFPDLDLLSSIYVVVEEDEIIGFGAIQPIFEAIVILNQDKSKDERLMALEMLEARAEYEIQSQGITQLHAFVQDSSFFNLLKKRYGYVSTKGQSLVKVI